MWLLVRLYWHAPDSVRDTVRGDEIEERLGGDERSANP